MSNFVSKINLPANLIRSVFNLTLQFPKNITKLNTSSISSDLSHHCAPVHWQYRITMGPELLQRKLPLRVPTVALPSSDLSLSKSYEEGQRLVRGVVIFS